MKWPNKYSEDWIRRFAYLPVQVGRGYSIWLTHYWKRFVPKNEGHVVGVWETTDQNPSRES